MTKRSAAFLWVAIAALVLIILVYVYFERRLEVMEKKVWQQPSSFLISSINRTTF